MRTAARRSFLVALTLACWTPRAVADSALQAVGDVSVGWTDNARSSPDQPTPDVPPKAADGFAIVSPGLVLALDSPRVIQRWSYTYSATLFYRDTGAGTSSHRLEYRSFFELSPDAALMLGASVMQSKPYASRTLVPANEGELGATLPSTDAFLSFSVDGLLSLELSRDWHGWQSAGFATGVPLFDEEAPRSTETTATTGLERRFRADAVGLEARGAYSTVARGVGSDGTNLDVQRQVVAGGVGFWRHDWGRDFTSRAESGVVRVQRLNSGRGFWHSVGMAALGYAVEAGEAELSYAHRITTNVTIGQSLVVDEVRLTGGVPLARAPRLFLGASLGYQAGRLIEEDASLSAHVDVLLADVALGWQATPGALVSLRYQHVEQDSDASRPPLPLDFVRNTVLLGVALRLPPDGEMPRAYRRPRRVDGSDEIREGAPKGEWWESEPRRR